MMISLRDVSKRFLFTWALRDVTLDLERGFHILKGPNGSGKSTLLKIMLGMLKPTRGRVQVFGVDPFKEFSKIANRVTFSLEGSPLPWWLSGIELLKMTCESRDGDWSEVVSKAEELGVTQYWRRNMITYSSGMKKKIILLLSLSFDAELYILDEPFTLLDKDSLRTVISWIREKSEDGKSILLASHFMPSEVERLVDTVIELFNGRIVSINRL